MIKLSFKIVVIAFITMINGQALAWLDNAHVAIAKAAGYEYWFNAAGADITKTKAGNVEGNNHYFNNEQCIMIDTNMVLKQEEFYDHTNDEKGHLYGAIVASIMKHNELFFKDEYVGYHMAFASHYIGDLSMPIHNIPRMKDGYPEDDMKAKEWHLVNDGVVESIVLKHPEEIKKRMYIIILRDDDFKTQLAVEIARIAKLSCILGEKLRKEKRIMTQEEAFTRLAHSASLLKAVLEYYKRNK
jgi:hypothetical protein